MSITLSAIGGVALSVVVTMILGILWYSPALFGPVWMRLQGLDAKKAKSLATASKDMHLTWVLGWVIQIVFTCALAIALRVSPTLGVSLGMVAFLWFGFVATTQMSAQIWSTLDISLQAKGKIFLINTSYSIVSMVLTALIVYYMR